MQTAGDYKRLTKAIVLTCITKVKIYRKTEFI